MRLAVLSDKEICLTFAMAFSLRAECQQQFQDMEELQILTLYINAFFSLRREPFEEKQKPNHYSVLLPYFSQMKIVALNDFVDMTQRSPLIYFDDKNTVSSNVLGDDLKSGYYYQKQLCKTDNAPKDNCSKPLFV